MRNPRLVAFALVLGIVASTLGARPVVGADEPKLTQQEIEKIVHDYLLREPEVLAEALRLLQQRSRRRRLRRPSRPSATISRHSCPIRARRSRATRRVKSPSSSS